MSLVVEPDAGDAPETPEVLTLAATDPANPYGTTLKWPAFALRASAGQAPHALRASAGQDADGPIAPSEIDGEAGRAPTRTVGALVMLVNGALAAERASALELPAEREDLSLGAKQGKWRFFAGGLDELAVYDYALPASRAYAHWRVGSGGA